MFTSDLIISLKSRFVDFRRHSTLFKFIICPHETCVEALDLTVIPSISVGDLEIQVADFKKLDIWVEKCQTLESNSESLAKKHAELPKLHNWNNLKKILQEDNFILQTWNVLPLIYSTMENFCSV